MLFKKIFKIFLVSIVSVFIVLLMIFLILPTTDITSYLVRYFGNVKLKDYGVELEYRYIARGMRQSPFIFPFSNSIYKFTKGNLRIAAINSYTVGDYDKESKKSIKSVSNFLDPFSKFKDSWFGVFIIIDDGFNKARDYILKFSDENPADISNFSEEALLNLNRIDQMVIVHTTHQKQAGYSPSKLFKTFYFKQTKTENVSKKIKDKQGRVWLKIYSEFETISALTDIKMTEMSWTHSIRPFVGLPNEDVYKHVDPWHPVTLKGVVYARYFRCRKKGFWAVVYCNGSVFKDKKGNLLDNWKNSNIQNEFEKMFMELKVGCRK